MVVSKKEMELVGPLSAGQRWQVEAIERHIDECLEKSYTPGGKVMVPLDYHPDERVRRVIVSRCRKEGWEISFEPGPSDRYCITLQ